MLRRFTLIPMLVLAWLTLIALGACESDKRVYPLTAFSDDWRVLPPQQAPGLVASNQRYIPDVPYPIRFLPLSEQSRSEATPVGGRVVHHVYQGLGSTVEVVNFYRSHLRLDDWKPQSETNQAPNHYVMNYTKGSETLAIDIRERWGRVTITIDIR
jgi:hypothetical protein